MSTELDPFFAALRHDADVLPSAAPEGARRRGRQRRRRTVLAASVAAFVVLASVALVLGRGPNEQQPAPPVPADTPTSTPVVFDRLVPVGPGIPYGSARKDRPALSTVVIVGERAYVTSKNEDPKQVTVVALDVTTGRKLWGPVALGEFYDATLGLWHPRYPIVWAMNDSPTAPDVVFVLDPDTGRIVLRLDGDAFDLRFVFDDSTLVIGSRTDRTTRGYDLATGRVRWSVPVPSSRIAHVVPMQRSPGPPVESLRTWFAFSPYTAQQFVQITEDGTATLRDVATGREAARRTGVATPPGPNGETDHFIALDGILYRFERDGKRRIQATTLAKRDPARTMYTPGTQDASLYPPIVCGTSRFCFAEQTAAEETHLVALDTVGGRVLWRVPIAEPPRLSAAVASQVVVDSTVETPGNPTADRSDIFDSAGQQLLAEPARRGTVGWIDDRAVLLFEQRINDAPVQVSGISPLESDPVPLGEIAGLRGCGWSRSHLVCATLSGIKVWRFAKA